jgi:hypothetical protein
VQCMVQGAGCLLPPSHLAVVWWERSVRCSACAWCRLQGAGCLLPPSHLGFVVLSLELAPLQLRLQLGALLLLHLHGAALGHPVLGTPTLVFVFVALLIRRVAQRLDGGELLLQLALLLGPVPRAVNVAVRLTPTRAPS